MLAIVHIEDLWVDMVSVDFLQQLESLKTRNKMWVQFSTDSAF